MVPSSEWDSSWQEGGLGEAQSLCTRRSFGLDHKDSGQVSLGPVPSRRGKPGYLSLMGGGLLLGTSPSPLPCTDGSDRCGTPLPMAKGI